MAAHSWNPSAEPNRITRSTLLWAVAASLAARCTADELPRLIPSPPAVWKLGDDWPLVVERFPPSGDGDPARYRMHVIVVRELQPGGRPNWRLKFLLPVKSEVPPGVEGPWLLALQKQDGTPTVVSREDAPAPPGNVRSAGEVAVVAAAPDGFPLEVFFAPLDYEQDEFPNAQGALTLRRQADGANLVVEAVYQPAGGEAVTVRQTWVEGEPWWRDYERLHGDRRDLHAWREVPTAPAAHPSGPPAEPEDVAAIRQDPRLQAPLTLDLARPRLSDLTHPVQAATGVPLTLDDGLDRDAPRLGGQSFHNIPAWLVMRQTAELVGPDARWEKADAGYRLHGAWPPLAASKEPGGVSGVLRWWLTGGSLVAFAAVAGWFVYRRLRKRVVAAPARRPPRNEAR